MENFDMLDLPAPLSDALKSHGFDTPTPIQAQAIPHIMNGRDVLGSAQTGTGKTGAFGIPLVAQLMEDEYSAAIILTPTRELATQVLTACEQFLGKMKAKPIPSDRGGRFSNGKKKQRKTSGRDTGKDFQRAEHEDGKIATALLIGGDSIAKQIAQLRRGPRLIVGTPGRVNDHLRNGKLDLSQTNFLILDETDRMLDMGFTVQIEDILKHMPKQRQTLLFSATFPKNINALSAKYQNSPLQVSVGQDSIAGSNIAHDVISLKPTDKHERLMHELHMRKGSILVFVKTKWGAEKMAQRLRNQGHIAEAIHGNLKQNKRDNVIKAFRAEKFRILVATDIAARGLDIPHIEHVINFDLPQSPEDYIHRIGRTARAGKTGEAIAFVTNSEQRSWAQIRKLMGPIGVKERSIQKHHSEETIADVPAEKAFNPYSKGDNPGFDVTEFVDDEKPKKKKKRKGKDKASFEFKKHDRKNPEKYAGRFEKNEEKYRDRAPTERAKVERKSERGAEWSPDDVTFGDDNVAIKRVKRDGRNDNAKKYGRSYDEADSRGNRGRNEDRRGGNRDDRQGGKRDEYRGYNKDVSHKNRDQRRSDNRSDNRYDERGGYKGGKDNYRTDNCDTQRGYQGDKRHNRNDDYQDRKPRNQESREGDRRRFEQNEFGGEERFENKRDHRDNNGGSYKGKPRSNNRNNDYRQEGRSDHRAEGRSGKKFDKNRNSQGQNFKGGKPNRNNTEGKPARPYVKNDGTSSTRRRKK